MSTINIRTHTHTYTHTQFNPASRTTGRAKSQEWLRPNTDAAGLVCIFCFIFTNKKCNTHICWAEEKKEKMRVLPPIQDWVGALLSSNSQIVCNFALLCLRNKKKTLCKLLLCEVHCSASSPTGHQAARICATADGSPASNHCCREAISGRKCFCLPGKLCV